MILAHAVLILIALAVIRSLVLRRNYITPLGLRPYRGGWQVALGLMVLYFLQAALVVYAPGETQSQALIFFVTHAGFAALLLVNRHIPGVKLAVLGIVFNLVVVLANGGWMPITPAAAHYVHPERPVPEIGIRPVSSKNIVLLKEDTNLWVLSDIIRVTVPWRRSAISIGDLLLVAGIAQSIFQVKPKEKKQKQKLILAVSAGDDLGG